jgi:hypothetical protein
MSVLYGLSVALATDAFKFIHTRIIPAFKSAHSDVQRWGTTSEERQRHSIRHTDNTFTIPFIGSSSAYEWTEQFRPQQVFGRNNHL